MAPDRERIALIPSLVARCFMEAVAILPRAAVIQEHLKHEEADIRLHKPISAETSAADGAAILKVLGIWLRVKRALDAILAALTYVPAPEESDDGAGIPIMFGATAHPNRVLGPWLMLGLKNFARFVVHFATNKIIHNQIQQSVTGVFVSLFRWEPARDRALNHRSLFNETMDIIFSTLREGVGGMLRRLFTWICGDLDGGSPEKINREVITGGAHDARHRLIAYYQDLRSETARDLRGVRDKFDPLLGAILGGSLNEKNSLVLSVGLRFLRIHRAAIEAALHRAEALESLLIATSAGYGEVNAFESEEDLVRAIDELVDVIREARERLEGRIWSPELIALSGRLEAAEERMGHAAECARAFGIAAFDSDPRLNAKALRKIFPEVFEQLAGYELTGATEDERKRQLIQALRKGEFPKLASVQRSKETEWLLGCLAAFSEVKKRNGRLDRVLVAQTENVSDILSVILLLESLGMSEVRVVALFETPLGLARAEAIMDELVGILIALGMDPNRVIPMFGLSDGNRLVGATGLWALRAAIRAILANFKRRGLKTPLYLGLDLDEALRGALRWHSAAPKDIELLLRVLGVDDTVSEVFVTVQGDGIFFDMIHPLVTDGRFPRRVRVGAHADPVDQAEAWGLMSGVCADARGTFNQTVGSPRFERLLAIAPLNWPFEVVRSVRAALRIAGKGDSAKEIRKRVSWESVRAIMAAIAAVWFGWSVHLHGIGAALAKRIRGGKLQALQSLFGGSEAVEVWIRLLHHLASLDDPVGFAGQIGLQGGKTYLGASVGKLHGAAIKDREQLLAALSAIADGKLAPVVPDPQATFIRQYVGSVMTDVKGRPQSGSDEADVAFYGIFALLGLRGTSG